jgi:hypothetical protein
MNPQLKKYAITLDIDWAPDCAIEYCLDLLDEYKVKATFFVTHKTKMNSEIERRGHLLGIHPNFLPNSTQGNSVKEIIEECLLYAPNAWCIRMHALVQSSPLLHEVFGSFKQLKLDVSLLMHRSEYAHKCLWDFGGVKFERLLYNWEDDAEFSQQRFSDNDNIFFGDLTVFDFHPIHVLLNSSNGSEYANLKTLLNGRNLTDMARSEMSAFRNKSDGVEDFFRRVLNSKATSIGLNEI